VNPTYQDDGDVMKILKSAVLGGGLRTATQCLLGSLALASLTFICHRLRFNFATAALLYLIIVVLLSLTGDFLSSIVVSGIASLCLALLAPPIDSFRVADPQDIVAIVAFLITSLVIISLSYRVRKLANGALESVRRQLVETEERERSRVARDLYDDICQRLTLVVVQLQELNDCSSTAFGGIDELRKQTSEIAIDVQALAHELHFAKLEYLGLAASMRSFCREFSEQQKVEIDFRNDDLVSPPPPHISTCLFRILQEALHNAAKHSGVRHFEVALRVASDAVHLTVHDSGLGFDRKEKLKRGGLGLVSMQERLKLVKGNLSIDSQVKRGTTIHASVPLGSVTSSSASKALDPNV
jgi:signal transduction histidine kinase